MRFPLLLKHKVNILSIALVPPIFVIVMISIAATSVQAYPTDGLFAQQITQTAGAIINYRPPSEIQKYINNDPTNVEQVLQKLIWQVYRTSNLNQTLQVANEITRQVGDNPESFTGDSIFWFAYRIASGQANKVSQLIGHVTPPPSANDSIESFNNIAINDATYSADAAQRLYNGVNAVMSGNTSPGFRSLVNKTLARDPNNLAALEGEGLALYNLGNYIGAIKYYDKVLALNSSSVNALNNKGNALAKLGRYNEALINYKKALEASKGIGGRELVPQYYNPSQNNDRILDISYNSSTTSPQPNEKDILTNVAIVFIKQGNYGLAIQQLDIVLSMDSNYYPALFHKGEALAHLGNYTAAYYYSHKASEINHDYSGGYVTKSISRDNIMGLYFSNLQTFIK
jgi:tetratricopeptide (TPR) repeat protein